YADLDVADLQQRENWLAVELEFLKPPEYDQILLSAFLDPLPQAGTQVQDVFGQQTFNIVPASLRAAVCDLCTHLASQRPACASSCPHDAAIRINPLTEFRT